MVEKAEPYKVAFNVFPTMRLNSNLFLSKDIVLEVIKVKSLRGGRSGDSVMLVNIGDSPKNYLLKVFKSEDEEKKIKNINEITSHLKFMKMFDSNYMPCPVIYAHGTLSLMPFQTKLKKFEESRTKKGKDSENLLFILMEALNPPYELNTYIESVCKGELPLNPLNLIDVLLQLFYILSMLTLTGMLHCDLHAKNIMIVEAKSPVKIDLIKIGIHEIVTFSKYQVKIIDFGEASNTTCRLQRHTSKNLNDLKSSCGIKRDISLFLRGNIATAMSPPLVSMDQPIKKIKTLLLSDRTNVDFNFYIRLIEILSTINVRVARINVSHLKDLSKRSFEISSKFSKGKMIEGETRKDIIRELYHVLFL